MSAPCHRALEQRGDGGSLAIGLEMPLPIEKGADAQLGIELRSQLLFARRAGEVRYRGQVYMGNSGGMDPAGSRQIGKGAPGTDLVIDQNQGSSVLEALGQGGGLWVDTAIAVARDYELPQN